jgi:hypothetical protein
MTAEPTNTTHLATARSLLLRMGEHLAPRFGAPGSISLAVSTKHHARRHRS